MKNNTPRPGVLSQPSEHDIREYAYQLYAHSDGAPGHDRDHWFEASAFLRANIQSFRNGTQRSLLMADPSAQQFSIDS